MDATLPFRHEEEPCLLKRIHPIINFLIPFILVIPFLIVNDIYLTCTIIVITLIIGLIIRIKILRVLSRIKKIIPFVLLMTIFIPFYFGSSVILQLGVFTVYREGLEFAILLLLRIFGAIFVFLTFFSSLTYSEFIETLTKLRLPSFFIGSFIIMLHYIPILANSNKKILIAQELRGKKITTYKEKLKTHAYIMGKSIVMNMERSERLYESLKMRGYSGKITFAARKIKFFDVLILVVLISSMIFFVLIDLRAIYTGVVGLFLP